MPAPPHPPVPHPPFHPHRPLRVFGVPAEYFWLQQYYGPGNWTRLRQNLFVVHGELMDELVVQLADGRVVHLYFLPHAPPGVPVPVAGAGDAEADLLAATAEYRGILAAHRGETVEGSCAARFPTDPCMRQYCQFMATPAFNAAVVQYGSNLPPEFQAVNWIAAHCTGGPAPPSPLEEHATVEATPPPFECPPGEYRDAPGQRCRPSGPPTIVRGTPPALPSSSATMRALGIGAGLLGGYLAAQALAMRMAATARGNPGGVEHRFVVREEAAPPAKLRRASDAKLRGADLAPVVQEGTTVLPALSVWLEKYGAAPGALSHADHLPGVWRLDALMLDVSRREGAMHTVDGFLLIDTRKAPAAVEFLQGNLRVRLELRADSAMGTLPVGSDPTSTEAVYWRP